MERVSSSGRLARIERLRGEEEEEVGGGHVTRSQPWTQLAPPTRLVTDTVTQVPLEVWSGFMCEGFAKLTVAGLGILKEAAAFDMEISPVPDSHESHRAMAISLEF